MGIHEIFSGHIPRKATVLKIIGALVLIMLLTAACHPGVAVILIICSVLLYIAVRALIDKPKEQDNADDDNI